MTDILPTYRCFDDALELIEARVKETPTLVRHDWSIVLVHGICVGDDGTRYAHAWVEELGKVWDAGLVDGQRLYYAVARAEYYEAKRVEESTRYTLRDILRENRLSGNYGPWKPAYLTLCGKSERILGKVAAQFGETAR
jgi:hypothetical protein